MIAPVVLKMGDQEQQAPGRISRMSIGGFPMNGVYNEGGARSRSDEQADHPMSISGKGYRGRGSRAPWHFAVSPGRWGAGNVGTD